MVIASGNSLLAPSVVQPSIPLPCKIADEVVLRELTESEAGSLFYRIKRQFDASGRLTACQSFSPTEILMPIELPLHWQLASSRVGYEIKCKFKPNNPPPKILRQLNFALKLCLQQGGGLIAAAPMLEDRTLGPSRHYFPPFPDIGKFPKMSETELACLIKVLAGMRSSQNDFEVFSELLDFAFSSGIKTDIKCITLFAILEMLYVADNKELGYKLALRSAKILKKSFDWFNNMKDLYGKRGKFVHQGKSVFSGQDYDFLVSLTQESLILKILSPASMDVANFEKNWLDT